MKADELCTYGESEVTFPGENEIWAYNPFEFNHEFEQVGCAFPTPAAVEAKVEGSLSLEGLTVPDKDANPEAFFVLADILAIAIEETVGGDAVAEIISIGGVFVHDDHDDHEGHDHRKLINAIKVMKGRALAATDVDFQLMVFQTCAGSSCGTSDTDAATTELEALTADLATTIENEPTIFQEALVEAASKEAYYSGVTIDVSAVTASEVSVQEVEIETMEAYVPPEPAPPTAEDLLGGGSAASLKLGFSALVAAAVAFIVL